MPIELRRSLKRRLQSSGNQRLRDLTANKRPSQWAQRLVLDGVRNLHRVNEFLYRSAQPSEVGMRNLERLGIRRVINLRAFHCDLSKFGGTGLVNHRLHVFTWTVQERQVIRVLRMLRSPENGPFLIHCKHGADRTGLMTAMFRIVEQGWSKQAAIQEMVQGGYGYHAMWQNIIRYIEEVDIERIRRALGVRA
jgi:protein tyrosine/serine phosphatase